MILAAPEWRRSSVREIERAIMARIARGEYLAGSRLPTCERLGRELQANKNTVSKAYQSLARQGFTISQPGRGTFVVQRPPQQPGEAATTEVRKLLEETVLQAGLTGLSAEALETLAVDTIRGHYGRTIARVGYVDCNRIEARELSRELQLGLSTTVEPLVVADVLGDDASAGDVFDLLAVNLAHLGSVERRLRRGGRRHRVEIVPVVTHPDPVSLTQVARLPANTRLLIVADTEDALHSLTGLARGVSPLAQVSGLLSSSPHLADALDGVDVVLVTRTARRRVASSGPGVSTIVASFRLDEASVREVAERLAAIERPDPAVNQRPQPARVTPTSEHVAPKEHVAPSEPRRRVRRRGPVNVQTKAATSDR